MASVLPETKDIWWRSPFESLKEKLCGLLAGDGEGGMGGVATEFQIRDIACLEEEGLSFFSGAISREGKGIYFSAEP
ncbi:hypothetical protein OAG80_01335 [Akkermansiaceae bacterium]|nr:hypothetical protein [Akkermansiaceae bacterium]